MQSSLKQITTMVPSHSKTIDMKSKPTIQLTKQDAHGDGSETENSWECINHEHEQNSDEDFRHVDMTDSSQAIAFCVLFGQFPSIERQGFLLADRLELLELAIDQLCPSQ